MAKRTGVLVVSLDLELYWGIRDELQLTVYKDNLLGVRFAVPEILDLFNRYGVHATWATVGLLFYKSRDEVLQGLPPRKPGYRNKKFSPYNDIENIGSDENEAPYHYGHSLINTIISVPGQEIGGHTFSHYYCLEEGQDAASFREDLLAFLKAVNNFPSLTVESLVFPKHQINPDYLPCCREHGIKSYRGNESAWFYRAAPNHQYRSILRRCLRFIDSYIGISGHNAYSPEKIKSSTPFNIPSSRFLRPYTPKLRLLEPLKLRRILNSMTYAAQKGLVYHLWWHPHNFGVNLLNNLNHLEQILKHYILMRGNYGMESMNMRDLSYRLANDTEK